MTNTVQVYSFIDKCFPNFPNWIVQLNTNSQKYFQPKILNVLFRRHKGAALFWQRESFQTPQILVLETSSFRVGFLNKIFKINLQNAIQLCDTTHGLEICRTVKDLQTSRAGAIWLLCILEGKKGEKLLTASLLQAREYSRIPKNKDSSTIGTEKLLMVVRWSEIVIIHKEPQILC